MSMYLTQIAMHEMVNGRCGAPESNVVKRLANVSGCSEALAKEVVNMAVRDGDLIRIACDCR